MPGVDPFIVDGGLLFLNPAAFATPKPGTFGNLERNSIHGPNFWQVDAVVAKRVGPRTGTNGELRLEIFNIFNHTNFAGIGATLPNALPSSRLDAKPTRSSRVKPSRLVRPARSEGDLHRRHDRRHRHEPSGPVGLPAQFLARRS